MNESLDESAKDIWINQTAPVFTMPVDEMRRRVQRSKSKARRERIIATAAFVITLASAGVELAFGEPVRGWMNVVQVLALVLWFVYWPGHSWNSILSLGLAHRFAPCLEFYRRELTMRRDRYRQNLRVIVTMLVLIVPFVLRKYLLEGSVIFGLLLTFSLIAYFRMKREAPRIQAEIDELRVFERQVSG